MSKSSSNLSEQTLEILETLGQQIRLARLHQGFKAETVAKNAGISLTTLGSIEKGFPSVSIGKYAAVLNALGGLDKDLLHVAKTNDPEDKKQNLPKRVRKEKLPSKAKKVTIKVKRQ